MKQWGTKAGVFSSNASGLAVIDVKFPLVFNYIYSVVTIGSSTSTEFAVSSSGTETIRGTCARSGIIVRNSVTTSQFQASNYPDRWFIAIGK